MKTTIRNAEQWAAVCPKAVASASQAHIAFLIEDAKKDLAEMFAEVERLQALEAKQQGGAAQSAPAGEQPAPYGWVAAGQFFTGRESAVNAAGKTPCVEVYSRPQVLAELARSAERQAAAEELARQLRQACDELRALKSAPAGEREAFEAWYERTFGARAFARNADHSYQEPETEMLWAGWQARAALSAPSHGGGVAHTDCRSEDGITVGLIDSIITSCRVLSSRDLTCEAAVEALRDLRSDSDVSLIKPSHGEQVERLQMQLVACGVVALANTPESAARARDMHPDYMSASCSDVMRAVDREMHQRADLLDWAVERWHAEVSQRPLVNVNRRSIDDTWRQIIRRLGGDPVDLCGPDHDTLLAAAPALAASTGQEVGK